MPTSNSFPACCGVNIISGFPYDDENEEFDDEGYPVSSGGDWLAQQLAGMRSEVEHAEGTYCHCHLIALTPDQIQAATEIRKMGYVPIGQFQSCDGPYKVTLYARGLTLLEAVKSKKKAKPKPKKRSLKRRKK